MLVRLRYRKWLWAAMGVAGVLLLGAGAGMYWRWSTALFDTLICYGRVFDGERFLPPGTCVGIREGRVAEVGFLQWARARRTIRAWGRVVAPGLIDVHTHVEGNIPASRPFRAGNFIQQGVTTIVTGNCGTSSVEIGPLLARVDRNGTQVNVATLVGHNSIRRAVMRDSHDKASREQIEAMSKRIRENMRAGALGFSTGLAYAPGLFADRRELVALARASDSEGGFYVTHLRDEAVEGEAALREAIEIAREADTALHVSHFKVASKSQWGSAKARLSMLDAERSTGRRVTLDLYGYRASSTSTDILLPPEYRGARIPWGQILGDPKSRDRLVRGMSDLLAHNGFTDYSHAVIAIFVPDRSLSGKNIAEAAGILGGKLPLRDLKVLGPPADQVRTVLSLASRGGAQMVYFDMSADDVDTIMRDPLATFGSDSSVRSAENTSSHPRGFGNFPRILAEYVRQRGVLSLDEALRRMTSLPADTFGLPGRGRLRPGAWADVVIFDAAAIQDRATFEDPLRPPAGIDLVLVNGGVAIRAGDPVEENFGRAIRRAANQEVTP